MSKEEYIELYELLLLDKNDITDKRRYTYLITSYYKTRNKVRCTEIEEILDSYATEREGKAGNRKHNRGAEFWANCKVVKYVCFTSNKSRIYEIF